MKNLILISFLIFFVSCRTTEETKSDDSGDTRTILIERMSGVAEKTKKMSIKYEAFDKTEDKRYSILMDMYHTSKAYSYRLKNGKDILPEVYMFLRSYDEWEEDNKRHFDLYDIND